MKQHRNKLLCSFLFFSMKFGWLEVKAVAGGVHIPKLNVAFIVWTCVNSLFSWRYFTCQLHSVVQQEACGLLSPAPLLSLPPYFLSIYITYAPPCFPAALEIHHGIDRKTSPVSRWMLGRMYITDQRFCCLLPPPDSNTTFRPVCVDACISPCDVYETGSLPGFSSSPRYHGNRTLDWREHICVQTH